MRRFKRTKNTSLNVVLSLSQNTAQIVAQFAPCPGLTVAVGLLCGIIEICQQVSASRHSARQLQDRCYTLLLAIRDSSYTNEAMANAAKAAQETLESVHGRIKICSQRSGFEAFLHQRETEDEISRCQAEVTSCYERLQLTSHSEIHNWQAEFQANQKRDHEELVHFLSGMRDSQDSIQQTQRIHGEQLTWIMTVMQQSLPDYTSGDTRSGLENNLYTIQKQTGSLLPEPNLKRGEVRKMDPVALQRHSVYDVYEGLYLGRQKVWMKQLRVPNSSQRNIERFYREAEIWSKLWARDQAEWNERGTTRRILPFLGFCHEDGPGYQYFVSPSQPNGTAKSYIISNPSVDRLKLIRGIAQGLLLLHTMDPPVVHGYLNASSVIIDDWGNPLLSDFGIAKVVEDVTGTAVYTHSQSTTDACRWWAPELNDNQELSTRSDVYSFGMTVLEIMTGRLPWHEIRPSSVILKAYRGERPERPREISSDGMWSLLVRCWDQEPMERPTIQEIIIILNSI